MTDLIKPPPAQFLRDEAVRGGMDLLLFAHRSHLRHADEELAKLGLGRAHHRALYFIARQPDLSVSGLLDLLAVTKQSLSRVLRALIDRDYVIQETGRPDRRVRRLRLSAAGQALEQQLFAEMKANMQRAYSAAGIDAVNGYWTLMQHLMSPEARRDFVSFQERAR